MKSLIATASTFTGITAGKNIVLQSQVTNQNSESPVTVTLTQTANIEGQPDIVLYNKDITFTEDLNIDVLAVNNHDITLSYKQLRQGSAPLGFSVANSQFVNIDQVQSNYVVIECNNEGKFDADYRFGFNGQMKDNEIAGIGNFNSAMFWEYDTRLGRRWNLDPKGKVGISFYATFGNNPIITVDPNGDFFFFYDLNTKTGGKEWFVVSSAKDLERIAPNSTVASQLLTMVNMVNEKQADPENNITSLLNSKENAVLINFVQRITRASTGKLSEENPEISSADPAYNDAVKVTMNPMQVDVMQNRQTKKITKHSGLVTFIHEMRHANRIAKGLVKSAADLQKSISSGEMKPEEARAIIRKEENDAFKYQNNAAKNLGESQAPCYDCVIKRQISTSPTSTE